MPSVLNVDTIADKAGTGPVALTKQEAAKAWINLNGNGTIAARDSLNISGLTDHGTGEYTVAFSSSFADANFCTTEAHEYSIDSSHNSSFFSFYTYTASSIRIELQYNATNYDHEIVSMASTGDLA